MTVPDLLQNAARRFPDRTCIAEGERALTFAEADVRASRAAAMLRELGAVPGDRVGLLAMNELEYLELQVAAQRAGVILVPLNFRLAVAELRQLVADFRPTVFVHGPGFAEQAAALGVPTTVHLGADGAGRPYDELLAAHEPAPYRLLDQDATSVILYTSGTTGLPKGAMLSNLAMYARSAAMSYDWGARTGSVFVQTLPMFHISANTAYSFTYSGSTIVLVRQFSVDAVVDTVARVAATHLLMVPDTINIVSNHPGVDSSRLASLQMLLYGGSSIAPGVLRKAIDVFGCEFMQLYGMTETSACTLLRPADHDPSGQPDLLSSAGTDAISFATRVVDETGAECPAGTVGEIVAAGPALMSGYWDAPEATADVLVDGWMHTGDLGFRDERGYLFVTDRLKDMIVTGGENVYPRQVEDVLYEHPGVAEVSVIGLPDETWGERVHALVVPVGEPPTPEELREHCRAALAGFKCPRSFEIVTALPKNAMGKILKRELRAARAAGSAG